MPEKALMARVTGRVQGVSFRAWTQAQAEERGLSGWVRNEDDGSVTALLAGPEAAVAEMLDRLREGPALARVTDVATEDAAAPGRDGFEIVGRPRPRFRSRPPT